MNSMADLIGQRLGQYEIVALLGKGGMATVYRARQLNNERDVAVKVISRIKLATRISSGASSGKPKRWLRSTTATSSNCSTMARRATSPT
jgi:serine/threonine protein kinase